MAFAHEGPCFPATAAPGNAQANSRAGKQTSTRRWRSGRVCPWRRVKPPIGYAAMAGSGDLGESADYRIRGKLLGISPRPQAPQHLDCGLLFLIQNKNSEFIGGHILLCISTNPRVQASASARRGAGVALTDSRPTQLAMPQQIELFLIPIAASVAPYVTPGHFIWRRTSICYRPGKGSITKTLARYRDSGR